jgi:phospholipase C
VLAGTYPNRFYLIAGTSFGHVHNDLPPQNGGPIQLWDNPTIFGRLTKARVSWKYYYGGAPGAPQTVAFTFSDVFHHSSRLEHISPFFSDLASNTLPAVSYIDPTFTDLGYSKQLQPMSTRLPTCSRPSSICTS